MKTAYALTESPMFYAITRCMSCFFSEVNSALIVYTCLYTMFRSLFMYKRSYAVFLLGYSFFPKALRRVLPENHSNTYTAILTLEHLHFYTYNGTEVSK